MRPFLAGLTLAALLLPAALRAQPAASLPPDFAAFKQMQEADFAAYEARVTAAFQEYATQESLAYAEFVRRVEASWGTGNAWAPTKTVWVEYEPDLTDRSAVDFDAGLVRVQLLVAATDSPEAVRARLAAAVTRLVLTGTQDPIERVRRELFPAATPTTATTPTSYRVKAGDTLWSIAKTLNVDRLALTRANSLTDKSRLAIGQILKLPSPATAVATATGPAPAAVAALTPPVTPHDPWLTDQVRTADGTPVGANNAARFGEDTARSWDAKNARTAVTGTDGQARTVVEVSFPLAPEHLRVRAQRFETDVRTQASRQELHPALLFAIIQTESAFNPRARSAVPAFGLMQLVPQTAGRDAYKMLYQEDRLLSPEYLFAPAKNIELGAAYVRLIYSRYLKGVTNTQARLWCTIAAYNTGAGNVARTFTGGTSMKAAAEVINAMPPDAVYQHLLTRLPYDETRAYLKKVRDRIPLYLSKPACRLIPSETVNPPLCRSAVLQPAARVVA